MSAHDLNPRDFRPFGTLVYLETAPTHAGSFLVAHQHDDAVDAGLSCYQTETTTIASRGE
jgi:hypothetical protein